MADFRYFRTDAPVDFYRVDSDAPVDKRIRRQEDGLWLPLPDAEGTQIMKRTATREVLVDAVPCPMCLIVAGVVTREVVFEFADALVIVPRPAPVAAGHRLVIPKRHVRDALVDPELTGRVFARAAEFAAEYREGRSLNLISSVGKAATQTEPHLHVHLVPRVEGDGLPLLWDRGEVSRG